MQPLEVTQVSDSPKLGLIALIFLGPFVRFMYETEAELREQAIVASVLGRCFHFVLLEENPRCAVSQELFLLPWLCH